MEKEEKRRMVEDLIPRRRPCSQVHLPRHLPNLLEDFLTKVHIFDIADVKYFIIIKIMCHIILIAITIIT